MFKNVEQREEIDAIVDELAAVFPAVDRAEIAALAESTYQRLARAATVDEHLVELTVNETRSALVDRTRPAEPSGSVGVRQQRNWANL